MNPPIKILFDENFGEPLVSALAQILTWRKQSAESPVEVRHLFKFAKPSEKDEEWVPKIAPGGWNVISTDRGKRCGGRRLPQLCCKYGVTHFLISGAIHDAGQFEKIRAVVGMWPWIEKVYNEVEKGCRFVIRYDGHDKRIIMEERLTERHSNRQHQLMKFQGHKKKNFRPLKVRPMAEIPENERLFSGSNGK